jgi:hypothetical protein
MKKLLLSIIVIGIVNGWSICGIAQQPTNSQQPVDEEETLDNAIEKFGYESGIAFQCVSSNEAVALQQDAIQAFTGISRLFGSDRAFFYAAAYGSGATAKVDLSQCAQRVREFREAIQKGGLKEGGQR